VLQGSPTTIEEALVDTGVAPEATLSATPGRAVWRSITKNKISLGGLVVLVILVLVAILAPLIAPYNPNVQVGAPFAAPSGAHLLGLDDGGYDVLSLLMWGLRVSLLVGFASTVIAGLFLGTVAFMVTGIQPVLLGALAEEGRLSEATLGRVAWVEVLALALASAIGPRLLRFGSARRTIAAACLVLAIANAVVYFSHDTLLLILSRVIAGPLPRSRVPNAPS